MGLRDLSLTRALTTPPRRLLGPPSWVSNAVYALAAREAAQSVVEKDDANTQSPHASSAFPKRSVASSSKINAS